MCLAVPGIIVEVRGDDAVVDMQGNRVSVSRSLTPEAGVGTWVLVHAGFAIATVTEADARETWDYLRSAGDLFEDAAGDLAPQTALERGREPTRRAGDSA